MPETTPAQQAQDWVPDIDAQLERLTAIARLVLSAVAARADFGEMQTNLSSVQVSIVLLGELHEQIQNTDGAGRLYGEKSSDWLCFGGLLGVLDAEAWRLIDAEAGNAVTERDLVDLEQGLRQLVDLAERTLSHLRAAETTQEACHA